MSKWIEVKDAENIDLSEDKKSVHILYKTDRDGNCYIEIPIDVFRKAVINLDENCLVCGAEIEW